MSMPMSKAVLKWRAKQPEGAIMEPETFQAIKRKAARSGKVRNPEAVAGAAYWETAKAKFKARGK